MKIIKLFFLIIVGLCAKNLLHAQEAITTPVKPVESKPAAIVTKPVPVPEMNPGSKITSTTATAAQAALSPLKREENIKPPEGNKPIVKSIEGEKVTIPLSAENVKTFAGKAKKTEQPVAAPTTIDQGVKPVPATKPAGLKGQQNQ